MFGLLMVLGIIGICAALTGRVVANAAGPLIAAIVQLVFTSLSGVFTETCIVATYVALTNAKDGFGGRRLADVF
jgi:hypothetical protein